MIDLKLYLFSIFLGMGLFTIIIYLVRNEHLSLRYAFLWLITSLFFLLVACYPPMAKGIANALGINAPSNALFLLGIMFILSLLLMLTVGFSRLSDKQRELTQRHALLEKEFETFIGKKDQESI
jgi:hypothetical protein